MTRLWFKIIGLIEWAMTWVNDKGNISHSKQGMVIYGINEPDLEMTKKQMKEIVNFIGETYGWECDIEFAYNLTLMECADEEE